MHTLSVRAAITLTVSSHKLPDVFVAELSAMRRTIAGLIDSAREAANSAFALSGQSASMTTAGASDLASVDALVQEYSLVRLSFGVHFNSNL